MGELYEVVVFTASLSKYADPVLDMLDIHRVARDPVCGSIIFLNFVIKNICTFIRDNQFASKLNELPSFIPRDIYVVSDCQITRDLKVQPQGIKWPVYVENSSKYERLGYPFGYLIATQKDESSLDGLRQIFQNCKLDITAFSYRRPFTDGLDIYLRQITQTAVVKFDQIKEEVSANRLNIFKPIPMVEKKVGHSSLAKLTTIARAEFLNLLETQSEADPVHTLGTGDMGNYRDVIVKRKQSLLRDLYYDFDPNDKKKKDKRAFGSPFKNPDQQWSMFPNGLNPFVIHWSLDVSSEFYVRALGVSAGLE
ncbi:1411_t:CDS:2, partial [Entrophospora sp. SA101]